MNGSIDADDSLVINILRSHFDVSSIRKLKYKYHTHTVLLLILAFIPIQTIKMQRTQHTHCTIEKSNIDLLVVNEMNKQIQINSFIIAFSICCKFAILK